MANVVSSTLTYAPFFLQKESGDADPIYYTAADMRRFLQGLAGRSGILGSSHFIVTQAANVGMSIKVNSGFANVGGRYLVHLSEDQTIDLTGFTGNPPATRTHKVYLSVYDALTAGTVYAGKIDVVEDTGAGAPAPTTAAYTLQLATITVAKNQGLIQNTHILNTARHGGAASEYIYLAGQLDSLYVTAGDDITSMDFRALYMPGGIVRLSGSIKRADGKAFANGSTYTLGKMHPNLLPARYVYLSGPCSIYDSTSDSTGSYHWRLTIAKDGTMTAALPTGTGPKYLMFDGMSYDLD